MPVDVPEVAGRGDLRDRFHADEMVLPKRRRAFLGHLRQIERSDTPERFAAEISVEIDVRKLCAECRAHGAAVLIAELELRTGERCEPARRRSRR